MGHQHQGSERQQVCDQVSLGSLRPIRPLRKRRNVVSVSGSDRETAMQRNGDDIRKGPRDGQQGGSHQHLEFDCHGPSLPQHQVMPAVP